MITVWKMRNGKPTAIKIGGDEEKTWRRSSFKKLTWLKPHVRECRSQKRWRYLFSQLEKQFGI